VHKFGERLRLDVDMRCGRSKKSEFASQMVEPLRDRIRSNLDRALVNGLEEGEEGWAYLTEKVQ